MNKAITGEKSSIIPPPSGDLSIILFTGQSIGSVSVTIKLPIVVYLRLGTQDMNTLIIIKIYNSLKNTFTAFVSSVVIDAPPES